jgi:peptidoglycan hydrolase CwlO-like protein
MSKNSEKPKILSDVRRSGSPSIFRKISDPLGRPNIVLKEVPPKVRAFVIAAMTLMVFLAFSGFKFSTLAPTALSQSSEEERKNLESELDKLETEIDAYEKSIMGLQLERKTLDQALKLLNAQISKINLQIKATNIQLQKLDTKIVSLQKNIVYTGNDIDRIKILLASSLRQIYSDDEQSIVEMMLKNEKLSDLFNNINALTVVQDEVRKSLDQLIESKTNLIVQKDTISLERQDVLNLKSIQSKQKAELDSKVKEKNDLVKATKGQESKYQDLLTKTKQTAAQIRSRIFTLLGGGELTFGEAYKLAQFAEDQTGVRAALILAVMSRESNFGQNVGRCNWKTAMHPTRDQQKFLDMMAELGIDPESVNVSCANKDGAYGGAMGPAQFIPSTWVMYKDRIAKVTGNNPPSPWRNIDAFAATALYLKDMGAANQSYASERKAAAMYYAGSRWRSYLYSYGQWVVEKAQKFQEDIKYLND